METTQDRILETSATIKRTGMQCTTCVCQHCNAKMIKIHAIRLIAMRHFEKEEMMPSDTCNGAQLKCCVNYIVFSMCVCDTQETMKVLCIVGAVLKCI